GGFSSARLAGGRGDRRDAVLAALRVLGVEQAGRLGERAAVLVALFGTEVTRPVGTAAAQAISAGRWPALHLATAASDLLGPEQLEQVLSWTAPESTDPVPHGLASVLAEDLGRVLANLPRPRRLAVLRDLWEGVCADQWRRRRRTRLPSFPLEVTEEAVAKRYRRFFDDLVENDARQYLGRRPSLAAAARWVPDWWNCARWLRRIVHDALAATALLRVAIAVADRGLVDGVAASRDLLRTAAFLIDKPAADAAARRVPDLADVPARPGVYLLQMHQRLGPDLVLDRTTRTDLPEWLAMAALYGRAVREVGQGLLNDAAQMPEPRGIANMWRCDHFTQWRTIAGYTAVRPPESWDQPPLLAGGQSLAQRLRERPGEPRQAVETQADVLWDAELADALAQLDGYDLAEVRYGDRGLWVDLNPVGPHLESVPQAVAGAAQLVELGATLPNRPRTWAALVDGLLATAVIAEALAGSFPVPAPLSTMDGVAIPGTDARLELARTPHQLAEWAAYMGNCIAGSYYLDEAAAGRSVLAALRQPDGRIVANIELLPKGSAGWRIEEFRARFNADPESQLCQRVEEWVATLPGIPRRRPRTPPPREHIRGRPRRRDGLRELGEALDALAGEALRAAETAGALRVLDTPAIAAVTGAGRRFGPQRYDQAVREALAGRAPDLAALWRATEVRPLAAALGRLDPRIRDRYAGLDALAAEPPLPAARRRLARLPEVAVARAVDLTALRL
ncbi:MAG: hypothetical protein J2P15_21550, partial [Micromonosporaceae bacterium]|nr:hypothetical protein [Micromonosporaceae bacterium]